MRDLKNKLTSGKNTKNTQSTKGKMFGYQVLGFGGGITLPTFDVEYLIIAGGGGGGGSNSGGGGAGAGASDTPAAGTVNTGGGGGGGGNGGGHVDGAAGGTGIVIIRYRFQ